MPKVAWKTTYYLRLYELSREGLSLQKCAEALGMTKVTLRKRLKEDPAARESFRKGQSGRKGDGSGIGETFLDYVYQKLPARLKQLWSDLEAAEKEENPEKRIELLLEGHGRRTKQQLWVHALVCSNFNKNEACRKVGISPAQFRLWVTGDPDFADLVDQVQEMKKDFCEGALMALVAQGESAAVIFANKTLNRDRGYDPKVTVVHEGTVAHAHLNLDRVLEEMSLESKRELLAIVRRGQAKALPPRQVETEEVL